MAQTIKLKRSGTEGNIPTTSQLELGEVAINTYDGKMFIKKNVGGTESIVEISAAAADAILVEYQFTSTASQTTYSGSDDNTETLSYTPNAIQVFMNGILLDPGIDFTATNGTSIVLSEAADANDYLQIFAFKKKISDGQVSVDTFTGDDSTVAFTLSVDPGDENNTRVFIDGVYQSKDNYSVSGTTLTFSTAPPTGTAIEIEIGNRIVTLDTLSDLDLPDDVKLRLGTGQDLQIYHDGSTSWIQDSAADLRVETNGLTLRSISQENYITAAVNGAVTVYYDGSAKLATTNDGVTVTGDVEADEFIGDVRGAVLFKAQAGEALAKGEVVYISGISGNTTVVSKADADDASKMPAFGLVAAAVSSGNPVDIYTNGILSDIDTSAYSEGDELFVSTTAGALTATAPTGESAALQKIGKVTRSNATSGSIFIVGAGRSNAVPNLNEGRLFVGNSSNQAVADDTVHVDIANSRVGIGTTNPDRPLNVVGTDTIVAEFENTTATGNARAYVTAGTASASLTQFGQSHATTPNVTQLASPSETRFINAGVTVATMKSSGNVGIGTTSPSWDFVVSNAGAGGLEFGPDGIAAGTSFIQAYNRTSSAYDKLRYYASEHQFYIGGSNHALNINSNGNTGFGITTGIAGRTHVRGFGYFDKSAGSGEPNIRLRTATDSYGTEWAIGQTADSSHFGINHYDGTSWSNKLFVETGGNVGIGVSDPDQKLDVNGNIRIPNEGKIVFGSAGASPGDYLELNDISSSGSLLKLVQDNTTKLVVQGVTGNVGIGTDSPGAKLEVDDGGSAGEILLTRSGSPRVELSTNANEGELSLYRSNNAKQVYFSSYYNSYITSGNLGIGTTSPTTKLSVETPATDATNNLHRVDLGIVSDDNGHASGYAASGMRILGQAKNSSGDDHTVFLEFNTRDPSLNGSHGTSGFITLTTPDSQGTYGSGQLDFYVRNSAPYSFPNDPAVTSSYWMPSLFTIKSNGNIGIGKTSPSYRLHMDRDDGSDNVVAIQNNTAARLSELRFIDESDVTQLRLYYDNGSNRAYQHVNGNGLTIYSSQTSSEIAKFGLPASYNSSTFYGRVGIGGGVTTPADLLDITDGVSDTKYLRTHFPAASNYNAASANTQERVPVGLRFGWYSEYWQIGAARGNAADIDGFVISETGQERLVISNTGKVGISNTSPNYLLEVGSASSTESNIFSGRVNGDFIFNLSKANTNLFSIRNNGNSVVHLNTQNSARLSLGVSTGAGTGTIEEHLVVKSNGNVGIGTTDPIAKLHLDASAEGQSAPRDAIRIAGPNTPGDSNGAQDIKWQFDFAGSSRIRSWRGSSWDTYLSFFTTKSGAGSNNPVERMLISHEGDVRIGFNDAALQRADGQVLSIITPATGGGQGIALKRLDSNTDQILGEISWSNNTQDGQANIRVKTDGAVNTTDMIFEVNNAGTLVEALRIDGSNNGNVGIGATAPQQNLSVVTASNSATPTLGSHGGNFSILKQDGTASGAYGILMGLDSSGKSWMQVQRTDGTASAYDMLLQPSGGAVRIASSTYLGNSSEALTVVGGGDTACFRTTASSGGTALHLNRSASTGNLLYFTYGAFGPVGSIYTDGSGTTYNTTSDQRLKENIVDAPSASEDIDSIQVRSFDWKTNGAHQKYGMVAQELLEVVPEAVSQGYSEQDMMGVDYSKLVPMLVKELQSLRARVAELENK